MADEKLFKSAKKTVKRLEKMYFKIFTMQHVFEKYSDCEEVREQLRGVLTALSDTIAAVEDIKKSSL